MKNLIETWQISHKMNELLINAIEENQFNDRAAAKGRSVYEHFAHMHNVRLMWLKAAMAELLTDQKKLEKDDKLSKHVLLQEMKNSSEAISRLLASGFATGRIKGFKPHPEAFLGYIISHEAHHRGQITLILKENKHLPDQKVLFGLWEWGTK